MIRIVVVDDQKMVREGIKILLEKIEEIVIVGDIAHGKDALEEIQLLQPDIVLLDIDMPEIDGFTVAEKIMAESPQIKIIMLSSHQDESYVHQATQLGAKGYLLKNASSQELEWSIKLVSQGYSTIKSELLEKQFSRQLQSQPALALNTASNIEKTYNNSSVSVISEQDRANLDKLDLLLAQKKVQQKYSHLSQSRQSRVSNLFHNVRMSNAKKTLRSFEFRLLVFIILFCLGFLVFVALI